MAQRLPNQRGQRVRFRRSVDNLPHDVSNMRSRRPATAGPGQYGSEQVPAWFVATDQRVILAGPFASLDEARRAHRDVVERLRAELMRAGRPGKFIAERVAAVGVRFGLRCWPHGRFESRRWRNEPNGSATSPSCGSTAWATDLQNAPTSPMTSGFLCHEGFRRECGADHRRQSETVGHH